MMVNFEKLIEKLTCIMLQQNNLGFVETWEKRGPSESPLTGTKPLGCDGSGWRVLMPHA